MRGYGLSLGLNSRPQTLLLNSCIPSLDLPFKSLPLWFEEETCKVHDEREWGVGCLIFIDSKNLQFIVNRKETLFQREKQSKFQVIPCLAFRQFDELYLIKALRFSQGREQGDKLHYSPASVGI